MLSIQASFFDFDNDMNLVMYLLNQAVHTEQSYGNSSIREKRNAKTFTTKKFNTKKH